MEFKMKAIAILNLFPVAIIFLSSTVQDGIGCEVFPF